MENEKKWYILKIEFAGIEDISEIDLQKIIKAISGNGIAQFREISLAESKPSKPTLNIPVPRGDQVMNPNIKELQKIKSYPMKEGTLYCGTDTAANRTDTAANRTVTATNQAASAANSSAASVTCVDGVLSASYRKNKEGAEV